MRLYPYEDLDSTPATYETSRATGFVENMYHAARLTRREDLTISPFIPTEVQMARDAKLEEYRQAGKISEKDFNFFGRDMDGLASYARNHLALPDLPSTEEYNKAVEEEYAGIRQKTATVHEQAGFMGKVGYGVGMVGMYVADPVRALSLLTGTAVGATVLQAAMVAGGVDMAVEAVAQGIVYPHKQRIKANYSPTDAIIQVVGAGVGSAALTGLVRGAGKLFKDKADALTVQHGVDVIAPIAKEHPEVAPILHSLEAADPKANLRDVLRMLEEAEKSLDKKIPAQVYKALDEVDLETAFYKEIQDRTTKKEAAMRDTLLIEDRVEEIRRTVFNTETRQALVKELTDLKAYYQELRGVKGSDALVDKTIIEDRLFEIRKALADEKWEIALQEWNELDRLKPTLLEEYADVARVPLTELERLRIKTREYLSKGGEELEKGVPQGTPSPKPKPASEPAPSPNMVVEKTERPPDLNKWEAEVYDADDALRLMEDCR